MQSELESPTPVPVSTPNTPFVFLSSCQVTYGLGTFPAWNFPASSGVPYAHALFPLRSTSVPARVFSASLRSFHSWGSFSRAMRSEMPGSESSHVRYSVLSAFHRLDATPRHLTHAHFSPYIHTVSSAQATAWRRFCAKCPRRDPSTGPMYQWLFVGFM